MPSLTAISVPLEPAQQDQLRTMFNSPAFMSLREIISAHCTKWQADYLEFSLYATDQAEQKAAEAKLEAMKFNLTLDVLDFIQEKGDQWFRITLEQRR